MRNSSADSAYTQHESPEAIVTQKDIARRAAVVWVVGASLAVSAAARAEGDGDSSKCLAQAAKPGEAIRNKPARDLTQTEARDILLYHAKKDRLTFLEKVKGKYVEMPIKFDDNCNP